MGVAHTSPMASCSSTGGQECARSERFVATRGVACSSAVRHLSVRGWKTLRIDDSQRDLKPQVDGISCRESQVARSPDLPLQGRGRRFESVNAHRENQGFQVLLVREGSHKSAVSLSAGPPSALSMVTLGKAITADHHKAVNATQIEEAPITKPTT